MNKSLKALLLGLLRYDYVIESGTDSNGWHYKKYSSGKLEAERSRNIGQYTLSTTEVSPIKVGGTVTSALPSFAVNGDLEISLSGNSSNSAIFLERISPTSWRVAKVTSSNVTLQDLTVIERTVGATWK